MTEVSAKDFILGFAKALEETCPAERVRSYIHVFTRACQYARPICKTRVLPKAQNLLKKRVLRVRSYIHVFTQPICKTRVLRRGYAHMYMYLHVRVTHQYARHVSCQRVVPTHMSYLHTHTHTHTHIANSCVSCTNMSCERFTSSHTRTYVSFCLL